MESKSFVRPSGSQTGRPSATMDDHRPTKKKVSFEDENPKKKKFTINQYGNRVINNWCLFARRKIQKEREKAKKEVVVSEVTETDKKIFRKAYRRLMKERLEDNLPRLQYLKRLRSTRPKRPKKTGKKQKIVLKEGETYVPCRINYKKLFQEKKKKQPEKEEKKGKPIVSIPPMKKKKTTLARKSSILRLATAKKSSSTIVDQPPLRIRKYVSTVPCVSQVKPKFKPKIEYPPLTLRKT